jgi:hypothetical protein
VAAAGPGLGGGEHEIFIFVQRNIFIASHQDDSYIFTITQLAPG